MIEGNPKVLLEAMSCGVPIVGTAVEGISDVIHHQHNGILVPLDPKYLRENIDKLLSDTKLRAKLSHAARKTILEKYSSKYVWRQEIELIKNLAN